jgi:hypothetical protein
LSAAATIDYRSSEKTLLGTAEGVPIVLTGDHVPVEKTKQLLLVSAGPMLSRF